MIIIDHLEAGFAAAETEQGVKQIPLALLPDGVREGDVLRETAAGYMKDLKETEKRRAAAAAKLRRLKHE